MCLKKEKSRDAARSRRGKENNEFYELARLLPLSMETSSQLDKASIIRLIMSYLQLHHYFHGRFVFYGDHQKFYVSKFHGISASSGKILQSHDNKCVIGREKHSANFLDLIGSFFLKSLDGFVFIINPEMKFIYVSDTVSQYLGMSQVDLMGNGVFKYTHPLDHEALANFFRILTPTGNSSKVHEKDRIGHSCFVRMKCTLNKRGAMTKCPGYQVLCITVRNVIQTLRNIPDALIKETDSSDSCSDSDDSSKFSQAAYFGIAQSLPHTMLGGSLTSPTFVICFDSALRITYCEEQITALTGYHPDEVKGQTFYHFIHPFDLAKIKIFHNEIISKSQSMTPYIRWLLKDGQFLWSQAYVSPLIEKYQSSDEEIFICLCYIISVKPCEDIVPVMSSTTSSHTCDTNQLPVDSPRHSENDVLSNQETGALSIKMELKSEAVDKGVDNVACDEQEITTISPTSDNLHNRKLTNSEDVPESDTPTKEAQKNEHSVVEKNDHIVVEENEHIVVEKNEPIVVEKNEHIVVEQLKRNETSKCRRAKRRRTCDALYFSSGADDVTCPRTKSADNTRSSPAAETERPTAKMPAADGGLDMHSVAWQNPPNREIPFHHARAEVMERCPSPPLLISTPPSNLSLVHHYPLGINPGVLNSNPLLAKMLTNGFYQDHKPLLMSPNEQMYFAAQNFKLFTPILTQIQPHLVPTPPSVVSIVDELRKDPMRKVNPPNKVLLPGRAVPGQNNLAFTSSSPFLVSERRDSSLSSNSSKDLLTSPFPHLAALGSASVMSRFLNSAHNSTES